MARLLRQLEADLSRAESIEWIHEIAADAERMMRAENSDWFGVMRFHDVELITLAPAAPAAPLANASCPAPVCDHDLSATQFHAAGRGLTPVRHWGPEISMGRRALYMVKDHMRRRSHCTG
jgi:hypothetical protein